MIWKLAYNNLAIRMIRNEEVQSQGLKRIRGVYVVQIRKDKREIMFMANRLKLKQTDGHDRSQSHIQFINQTSLSLNQSQLIQPQPQQFFHPIQKYATPISKKTLNSQRLLSIQTFSFNPQDDKSHDYLINKARPQNDSKRTLAELNIVDFYHKQGEKNVEHHNRLILDEQLKDEIERIFNIDKETLIAEQLIQNVIYQQNIILIYEGFIGLRRLVSEEHNTQLRQKLSLNHYLVQKIMFYIIFEGSIHLKWQCLWIIINISTEGNQYCEVLVQKGIIIELNKLLQHDCQYIQWQSIIAIQNIAAASLKYRISFNQLKTLGKLILIGKTSRNSMMVMQSVQPINSLCICQSYSYSQQIQSAICFIVKLIDQKINLNKRTEIICLNTLIYCLNNKINTASIICPQIISILIRKGEYYRECRFVDQMFMKIMSIIEIISQGNQIQTQILLDSNVMTLCLNNLKMNDPYIMKDTIFILANLSASTQKQVQFILNHQLCLKICISHLKHGQDQNLLIQICHYLINIFALGKKEALTKIVQQLGVTQSIKDVLFYALEQSCKKLELVKMLMQVMMIMAASIYDNDDCGMLLMGSQMKSRCQQFLLQCQDEELTITANLFLQLWLQKQNII